jgi:hypothetical protein
VTPDLTHDPIANVSPSGKSESSHFLIKPLQGKKT